MTAPLRFKDNRDTSSQCSVLEEEVRALRAMYRMECAAREAMNLALQKEHRELEREVERRRDVERTLENFVIENRLLHDQLSKAER